MLCRAATRQNVSRSEVVYRFVTLCQSLGWDERAYTPSAGGAAICQRPQDALVATCPWQSPRRGCQANRRPGSSADVGNQSVLQAGTTFVAAFIWPLRYDQFRTLYAVCLTGGHVAWSMTRILQGCFVSFRSRGCGFFRALIARRIVTASPSTE